MITKEDLSFYFDDLKQSREIDVRNELLWGYFFFDSSLMKLNRLSEKLRGLDYKLVSIFKIEKEHKNDVNEYCLHVEKVEVHNIDSLHLRNQEFYTLVANNEVSYYDGFEVGNI